MAFIDRVGHSIGWVLLLKLGIKTRQIICMRE